MTATKSFVRRAIDTTGDDILTYTVDGKHIQAILLVDDSGNILGIASNKLQAEISAGVGITEYNLTLTNANTEYSYALPSGCRKVVFRCRDSGTVIRYAWSAGKVAGPTAPYQTLRAGAEYATDFVNLSGKTLYFATDNAGAVVEIEVWT